MSEQDPNTNTPNETERERETTTNTEPEPSPEPERSEPQVKGDEETEPVSDTSQAEPEAAPERQREREMAEETQRAHEESAEPDGGATADSADGRTITNPETKSRLDQVRMERQREEHREQIESAQKKSSARETLAEEEQPDPDAEKDAALNELLETTTVPFRGRDFEFAEFGDAIIEAQEFSDLDADEGSKAANFVYRVLGKKCVSPSYADEEFWRNFDFGSEDGNGILNLFNRLVEETQDITAEDRERIEEFRNER